MNNTLEIELFPSQFENSIHSALLKLKIDALKDSKKIADYILRLSDFYITHPQEATPWKETWVQIAYLAYYHPLNTVRNKLVVARGSKAGFFNELNSVIDFGAGLGSVTEALSSLTQFQHQNLIEDSSLASQILENNWQWHPRFSPELLPQPKSSLVSFSYSLTEVDELPSWATSAEALMILEPATNQDGRKLLQLRELLIQNGYSIWAPCLHQQACPLLHKSKTDWCHDRALVKAPNWFRQIEKHLPFRNETVTTSYLLARKKTAPTYSGQARTVGDHLREKGKSRQMICRGPEREFLSWLHRDFDPPVWPRGEIVDIPKHDVKPAELRVLKESTEK